SQTGHLMEVSTLRAADLDETPSGLDLAQRFEFTRAYRLREKYLSCMSSSVKFCQEGEGNFGEPPNISDFPEFSRAGRPPRFCSKQPGGGHAAPTNISVSVCMCEIRSHAFIGAILSSRPPLRRDISIMKQCCASRLTFEDL
ncbi:hypothetical protein DNTS_014737, partial [Danionella cerebrum]